MKLLSKDGEVHRQARLQATEALKASQELQQQLQTQLQHKDWVIKDITAVKDLRYASVLCTHVYMYVYMFTTILCLRIKELEDQTKRTESKLKKEEDKHIKRWVTYNNIAGRSEQPEDTWRFQKRVPQLL